MSIYPSRIDSQPILVFVEDFASYHLAIIRDGVQDYFDRAERSLSFVQVGITELTRFFGNSIEERLVVIGVLREESLKQYFEKKGIPCLNLIEEKRKSKLGFDIAFEGEGTLAAQYFMEDLKLEHIGYMGRLNLLGHKRRFDEITREAEKKGISISLCNLETQFPTVPLVSYFENNHQLQDGTIREFLMGLKKPAGIFCADDRIALDCHFNCEALGISVPNEVAILGVGSRSQAKSRWTRAVSVVEIDHHQLGFSAAKLMDEYIGTGKRPASIRLAPSGIHHNQTSIQRRVADALIQEVLKIIVKEPHVTVKEITERMKISRNILDVRFYRATNMTVSKMIEQERFRRAKELLRKNKYNVESIAGLAGYPNRRSMRRSFQRFTKMSPQRFRDWEKSYQR